MEHKRIQQIMAQVKSFPAMPATAAKVMMLLDDPDSTAAQLEGVIRYDPGLTANILKLTNSAYFGIPSTISSVKQAVVLLGWKRLVQLVMTMCMSPMMKKPIPGYDLQRGELWQHSIAVSIAAELIVKTLKIPGADEVFTAALLHDVGKLVLGNFVKEDLPKIKKMVAKGITFDVAEFMVLGTDHAQIGAQILKQWSFPPDLVNAVHLHHDPESCATYCILSDVVHIANTLGLMTGFGNNNKEMPADLYSSAAERLGLKPHHLEKLVEMTKEGVKKISDSLR